MASLALFPPSGMKILTAWCFVSLGPVEQGRHTPPAHLRVMGCTLLRNLLRLCPALYQ